MKRILLILTFALVTSLGWSQCNASFNITGGTNAGNNVGDTLSINNTSASSNTAVFSWTMTGGTPSTALTYDTTSIVNYQYTTAGTYTVCMIMNDSTWNCADTICDSILITSGALTGYLDSTAATCNLCNATATAVPSGGNVPYSYNWSTGDTSQTITGLCGYNAHQVTITDVNGDSISLALSIPSAGAGLNVNLGPDQYGCTGDSFFLDATLNFVVNSYLWSNGATSSSIAVNQSGMYYVTVTDSSGCSGADSALIDVSSAPSISASATNETCSSCCNGTANATASGSTLAYTWSNGSYSTSITGLCPGTYSVTVEDTLTGCSTSQSVTVSAYVASCYFLAGMADQGGSTRVYLIQEDSGSLSALDSATTDTNGLYMFSNVCNGTYYIKAALLSNHIYYTAIIPTYYDSAALWTNATAIVVNNASNYSVDIDMLASTNSGGAGFIGGLISQGANRGEGDPAVGAYVLAYNEDGSMAAFDKTDATGAYEFANLSLGSYEVYVDILNKTAYPHQVILTAETAESPNRDFEIIGAIVKPIAPTGLADIISNGLNVYPNPSNGFITIDMGSNELNSVNVVNLLGERIMSVNAPVNSQKMDMDLSQLASGSYLLEMNGEDFTTHQSIIIK